MNHLETPRWTTATPAIYADLLYDHYRDGTTMYYKFRVVISTVTGAASFGYPIYFEGLIDDVSRVTFTMKAASPSQWSSQIVYESGWFSVPNRVTGTTKLTFRLYSGSGSTRNQSWSYWINVLPAAPTANVSNNFVGDNYLIFNWTSSLTADAVQYRLNGGSWVSTGHSGTSGSYTISGLNENTTYNVQIRTKSQASQLWSNEPSYNATTLRFPYVTSSQSFTVGNSITVGIFNPLGRSLTLYMYNPANTQLHSVSGFTAGTMGYSVTPNATNLYNSLPNGTSSTYRLRLTSSVSDKYTNYDWTYSINQSANIPTFPTLVGDAFLYEDINAITLALTNNNQKLIRKYSQCQFTITNKAQAKNGATILRYRCDWGGQSDNVNEAVGNLTKVISGGINSILRVWAIDSRGLESNPLLINLDQNFINYTDPTVTRVSTQRQNGVDIITNLILEAGIWHGNFGVGNNSVQVFEYRTRPSNSPTWSAWFEDTENFKLKYNYNNGTITLNISDDFQIHANGSTGGFAVGQEFQIQIRISDGVSKDFPDVSLTNLVLNSDFSEGLNHWSAINVTNITTNNLAIDSGDIKFEIPFGVSFGYSGVYCNDQNLNLSSSRKYYGRILMRTNSWGAPPTSSKPNFYIYPFPAKQFDLPETLSTQYLPFSYIGYPSLQTTQPVRFVIMYMYFNSGRMPYVTRLREPMIVDVTDLYGVIGNSDQEILDFMNELPFFATQYESIWDRIFQSVTSGIAVVLDGQPLDCVHKDNNGYYHYAIGGLSSDDFTLNVYSPDDQNIHAFGINGVPIDLAHMGDEVRIPQVNPLGSAASGGWRQVADSLSVNLKKGYYIIEHQLNCEYAANGNVTTTRIMLNGSEMGNSRTTTGIGNVTMVTRTIGRLNLTSDSTITLNAETYPTANFTITAGAFYILKLK